MYYNSVLMLIVKQKIYLNSNKRVNILYILCMHQLLEIMYFN